jgi:Protein of unknown function (DUF3097)
VTQVDANQVTTATIDPNGHVSGRLVTPYVDIWQAIRPTALGLTKWPSIPRGIPWKEGIGYAFGEPSPGRLWKRLLGQVHTYADLEPTLVRAVESLIDFVTEVPTRLDPSH